MASAPAKKPAAKTAAKAAPKPAAAKPATAAKAPGKAGAEMPKPVLVTDDGAALAAAEPQAMMKIKDLVDRVSGAVSVKKKDVREVVEATLAALGASLEKGESFNLPPLGKAHIARQRDGAGSTMFVVKIRRGGAKPAAKEPLAETGDNG